MIPVSPLIGGGAGGATQLFLSGVLPTDNEAIGELNQNPQTFDSEWCAETLQLID